MEWKRMKFEKHDGIIDYSSGRVAFYKLMFDNIFQGGNFIRRIKPGNYQGWVRGKKFGLVDLDSGWIYTNFRWHPPKSFVFSGETYE